MTKKARKPPNAAASSAARSRDNGTKCKAWPDRPVYTQPVISIFEIWFGAGETREYYRLKTEEAVAEESVLVDTDNQPVAFYGEISRQLTPTKWTPYGPGILAWSDDFCGARKLTEMECIQDGRKDRSDQKIS